MTGPEKRGDADRRTMPLDETSDTEIDEMACSEIPLKYRYSVSEIPD
jgi:hypothetical protein